MKIISDGWAWILVPLALGGVYWTLAKQFGLPGGVICPVAAGCVIFSLFMVWFFRNPERIAPTGEGLIVSGAEGTVRAVETMPPDEEFFDGRRPVRVSVFLSPLNVQVNRCPLAGTVRRLAYREGRHLLTMDERSAFYNQHSIILIDGDDGTRCLCKQITGPIVRRVVYWLAERQHVERGAILGMMKFGSRMDVWLPADEVDILVRPGDKVRAGETIIAKRK